MAKKKPNPNAGAGILGLIGEIFILFIDLSMGIIIGGLMLAVGILVYLAGGNGKK
jgi:hypothetical protein